MSGEIKAFFIILPMIAACIILAMYGMSGETPQDVIEGYFSARDAIVAEIN